jgi:uncharacterized protein (TIGR02118 family)
MFNFVTLYRRVDDEQALETFFQTVHLRLGEQLPGLSKIEVGRVRGKPGGESRYQMTVTLSFDSAEAFETAVLTEQGMTLMPALKQWNDANLLDWYYVETWEEEK